jgi:glycosyltransferase involved in cell wall biosynthesis
MISIIIPARNEETTIAKQLEKFRAQLTAIPYELIVSDDNSTDNTIKEATPHADRVVSNPNSHKFGISAARNRGTHLARYPYLVFTDGGVDIPEMNKFFQKLLNNFERMPEVVGMTVNVRFFPAVETFIDKVILKSFDWWFIFSNNVLKSGAANGKFQMVKAEAFHKIGGYNETLIASEDFDLFNRLSKIGRTYSEPSLTVYHSGRRAKKVGWLRLLPIWILNGIWVALFKRAYTKNEWRPVR